jgi:hypothetical protein
MSRGYLSSHFQGCTASCSRSVGKQTRSAVGAKIVPTIPPISAAEQLRWHRQFVTDPEFTIDF